MGIPANKVHETLSKYMLVDGFPVVVDLEKSHGSFLVDAVTGKEYVDFFTFFASAPIGFNHPKMTTPEFIEKLGKVAVNKPSNSDLYTVEMAEFVETFATIAKPDYMKHLFFVSGGALAVENALKTAFDWKVRKNLKKGKGEKGYKVIHFKQAFHGRTGYTLSLTNTFDPRKTMYFPTFDWPRIDNPKLRFPITDEVIKEVEEAEKKAIQQIKDAIAKDGDDIACLIIEPIQGEGGDNHFRKEFFKELETICKESDIMFIVDEVQTGIGLTGKMWAYQHFDIKPDIIAFGKKTQVCGIMVSDRVDEVENNVFVESSRINSTWGGNLVDMVRSTKYLQIIDEEKLVDNAAKMGKYLMKKLNEMAERKPITNIRGRGLFCAFDLPNTQHRDKVFSAGLEKGVLILKSGEKSIRFRPPLNIKQEEIDKGLSILEEII